MLNILERMNNGQGVLADVNLLQDVATSIGGKCLCPLGDFAAAPVLTSLKQFRADFEGHAKDKKPAAPAGRAAARPAPAAKPGAAKAVAKAPAAGD